MRPDGIFTVENRETGEFRTFKLETRTFPPRHENEEPKDMRVVSYLRGPSNSSDFEAFAFVFGGEGDTRPTISVWKSKRSTVPGEKSECEKFAFLLSLVLWGPPRPVKWDGNYDIHEPIPCARCGEMLTVPDSIRRGIGPVCAKREASLGA